MSQKSYDNTPTLYLIPTPIGNMEDITLRAISILKKVEVIFSEDTRVTMMLLKYLGINKKLISNHKFNEEKNKERLLEYLINGYDIGLVTDRGTPIISDPGYGLAVFAIEKGYNVVSLPGATALIPSLTSSGLSPMPFLFFGFLNSKDGKRKKELEKIKNLEYTLIFYEAPHRLIATLNDMKQILGNRKISISREISKKYEEIYRGTIDNIITEMECIKGEFVIVVSGNKENTNLGKDEILNQIDNYIDLGFSTSDAIKKTAIDKKINKNDVYKLYHGGK